LINNAILTGNKAGVAAPKIYGKIGSPYVKIAREKLAKLRSNERMMNSMPRLSEQSGKARPLII
jgi:hypothetical protein